MPVSPQKNKYDEVDFIIDSIGEVESQDPETGVIRVKRRKDGKIIKVADLVNDNAVERDKIVNYLRLNGEIVNCKYDAEKKEIISKS